MTYQQQVSQMRYELCDLFTGADGGIGFVKFVAITDDIAKKADAGDEAAIQILNSIIIPFQRLVTLSTKGKR